MISIIVLACVFILIAIRQVGRFRFQIWQVMTLGAIAVLVTGQISPSHAWQAINFDVIIFLFGMFVVGQALEDSGYLSHLSYRIFGKARNVDTLLISILFGAGIFSAILMNDTLAIIGTPVMLRLSTKTGIRAKILLIALAFSVTIGSVMSPIGNPQNLLVALNGNITAPFITFLRYLALPTLLNLFLTYIVLRLFYRKQLKNGQISNSLDPINDPQLARISKISLYIIVSLIILKIIMAVLKVNIDFRLTYIALAGALPVILFSKQRFNVIRKIDWFTLVFFAAMFVLMESVWDSGFFQNLLNDMNLSLVSLPAIFGVSIILSQFISNVPLVALYLPVLQQLGAATREMMALAAGSTIAGNLSILGAASNVIIIQNAEKKSEHTITFWEFLRIGIPVTILNAAVYSLFLLIL